ncbi:MAG: ABC transporter permease, partial [Flavisolibacter sp.]|nr:ABC transporter permease [Flavisolibacter sp.]
MNSSTTNSFPDLSSPFRGTGGLQGAKIAWRNIWKYKVFSAINIFGLSIGLACCILMFLFIQHELSYDRFHVNANRMFRIISEPESSNEKKELAVTPAPWAPLMKKDYPEIQHYVRLLKDEKSVVGQPGEQHYYENDLLYADSTFFDVFTFGLERGEKTKALELPNSIVLTKEAAQKYFGTADPIGKTLEINSFGRNFTVQVTGIAEEIPSTSHFQFKALVSLQTLGDLSSLWSFHMFQSYVVVNDKAAKAALEKKFDGFVEKYIAHNPQADGKHTIHLQPLTSIHLHSNLVGELGANGDINYVYVFTGIALFILLIACFNFTNLSTARSLTRAKEVGLRKVVGAERKQLMVQFLGESVLFACIALIVAVGITIIALPLFNRLSGRQLSFDWSNNYVLFILFVLLILFVGLLAGIYPAAVLSSFKPVEVLKGRFQKSAKGVSFRKVLVTLQFVVSIGLIASTIIVNRQLHFLQNKKLGFNKENVLIVSLPRDTDAAKLEAFKTSLLKNKDIASVAAASSVPSTNIPVNQVNDGSTDLSKALSMQMLFTDPDFIRTMNMKLVAGRDFSKDFATDKTESFVLNEEAVKQLGWKDATQAVGKTFQWVQPNTVLKSGKVIGVVENFNIAPLKTPVQPLVMHYFPMRFQYLYVRYQQTNAGTAIALVAKSFKD